MNLFRSFLIVLLFTFSLHADDLCYEDPYVSGFFLFPKNTIPIKHTNNETVLEDVKIIYAISGFSFSLMEKIGIDGNTFSATVGDDDAERNSLIGMNFGTGMPNFSMFDKGYNYYLHQMSNGEVQETWTSEFFFTNWMSEFFSSTKLFAEYYKDGEFYRVILNPCSGNAVTVPTVSVANASMQSPTEDAIMTFNVTLSGTLSSEIGTDSYIHYKTLNDTAVAGVDYIAVDNTLVVPAGQTSADITVTIKAGASGKFKLLLDNAYGASISDGEAIGSIYSEYGLCYAGSTGDNINTGKCILAGAFYSATNKTPHDCDAQVTIINRDSEALSNVSVFKLYDSNANSGTCSGGDSCNGPSSRSVSGFPDHNSGYEYIWSSFAGDSNQTLIDLDTWSSSGDFDDIILYGTYTKDDGLTYAQKISSCGGGSGYIEEGLAFGDFIDTEINTSTLSNAYNASTDTSSAGLKFIKTKIASQTTPLTAVYLNDFGISTDYDNNATGDENKKLWFAIPVLNNLDVTGSCPSADSSLLQQIIDPVTGQQVIFTVKDNGASDYSQIKNVIIPSNASKNARIEMIVIDTSKLNVDAQNCVEVSSTTGNLEGLGQCVNSEVQYVDAYGQTAYDRCAINSTYGKPCLSKNSGVGTGLFNSPLGCFMCTFYAGTTCSSDNFAIRPNDFNATISPNQTFTAGTPEPITFTAEDSLNVATLAYNETEDSSFFVDVNISDSSKTCQEPAINFSPSVNFADGTVTDNYTLHNVGDFNVTIAERVGFEFALVDTDDTNDSIRLIAPYAQQIKVIPDHFEVVGGLTNGSNGFTYLSNFEQFPFDADRNISASLDLNISAQKADNNITSNYTQECYAKDGNITLTLNAITVTPAAEDGSDPLTKLLWHHYDNDGNTNGSIDLNTTAVPPYMIPFLSTHFDSNDTNGTANFNYKINFDRNLTKVVNPFMVLVTDIDAEDNDSVIGNNSLDSNATFVFGRTHATRQRYRVTEDHPYPANIYFESYCSGTGCDKTLLPNGLSSTRTDDLRWYVIPTPFHTIPTDGVVGTVTQKDATPANALGDIVTATPPTNTNPSVTNLTYTGTSYPYKTTMNNDASLWLIYNEDDPTATRNEFQVEFDRIGEWTGEHNTSTTTKTPAGATTNRRIMW